MNGLFIWIILGVVVYMLFSRRGGMGMGCCGGGRHDHNSSGRGSEGSAERKNATIEREDNVIELKKEDYRVISSGDHTAHHETH